MRFRLPVTLIPLLLAACGPVVPLEERNPAPSSSYTLAQIKADAAAWTIGAEGRKSSGIMPTGSMAPVLDSRSVALYEPYVGQELFVGDLVYFDRGDVHEVLHRIDVVTPTHVRTSGVNVRNSDGWIPKSKIKYRVAGVLYSKR